MGLRFLEFKAHFGMVISKVKMPCTLQTVALQFGAVILPLDARRDI